MREDEMVFLGMVRAPKTKEELANDPIKNKQAQMEITKKRQIMNQEKFDRERKEL